MPDVLHHLSGPEKADTIGIRTYSTNLNERSLREKFGAPDRTSPFQHLKALHYGWLEIVVSPAGEIEYLVRVINRKGEGEFQTSIMIQGRASP